MLSEFENADDRKEQGVLDAINDIVRKGPGRPRKEGKTLLEKARESVHAQDPKEDEDENGEEYANDGRAWNSDRSLAAKTHRCGIIDKGSRGVELCWGQGKTGEHRYFIIYVIDIEPIQTDLPSFRSLLL